MICHQETNWALEIFSFSALVRLSGLSVNPKLLLRIHFYKLHFGLSWHVFCCKSSLSVSLTSGIDAANFQLFSIIRRFFKKKVGFTPSPIATVYVRLGALLEGAQPKTAAVTLSSVQQMALVPVTNSIKERSWSWETARVACYFKNLKNKGRDIQEDKKILKWKKAFPFFLTWHEHSNTPVEAIMR